VAAIGHDVSLGAIAASSDPRKSNRPLLALWCEIGMDIAGGAAVIELGGTRTDTPAPGDPVKISLDGGDGAAVVFTGEVSAVAHTAAGLRVTASDGLARLARLTVAKAYDAQTCGAIVEDVLGLAGLARGEVDEGPTFPSFALHPGARALAQLRRLAEACGVDLFADGEGKVSFAGPRRGSASHRFAYGKRILELCLESSPPAFDGAAVFGEGTGAPDAPHWLTTDLSGATGKAAIGHGGAVLRGREGARTLPVVDGAVRSTSVAEGLAVARMRAAAARAVRGFARVLGAPAVRPAERVALENLPTALGDLGKDPLRVRRVRHRVSPERGFVTRMEF